MINASDLDSVLVGVVDEVFVAEAVFPVDGCLLVTSFVKVDIGMDKEIGEKIQRECRKSVE